jgi:hypothetical protein
MVDKAPNVIETVEAEISNPGTPSHKELWGLGGSILGHYNDYTGASIPDNYNDYIGDRGLDPTPL